MCWHGDKIKEEQNTLASKDYEMRVACCCEMVCRAEYKLDIFQNWILSTVHLQKFKFSQILLGDKNATSHCSKIISTLTERQL